MEIALQDLKDYVEETAEKKAFITDYVKRREYEEHIEQLERLRLSKENEQHIKDGLTMQERSVAAANHRKEFARCNELWKKAVRHASSKDEVEEIIKKETVHYKSFIPLFEVYARQEYEYPSN